MTQIRAYLVCVTTDERAHQLWVAASVSGEEAIVQVLSAVPAGWSAALLSNRLKPQEVAALNLKTGQVRQITRVASIAGASAAVFPSHMH